MQSIPFSINSPADLPAAIVASEQAGAIGQAHLLRALAAGRIGYATLMPDSSASKWKALIRATMRTPQVVLIGDDDGLNRGPAGWPLASKAVRWAHSVLLHGAGAELSHYEAAVFAAQITLRTLVVECCSATLPAWVDLVKSAPHRPQTLVIAPTAPHPIPADPRSMH